MDELRESRGVSRKAVYELAGIDKETWRRTANGATEPNMKTLRRLNEALEKLIAAREAAE